MAIPQETQQLVTPPGPLSRDLKKPIPFLKEHGDQIATMATALFILGLILAAR